MSLRAFLAIAVLAWSSFAFANVGRRTSGGVHAGELVGIDVNIAHEELVIDARPVADGRPIAVSATYHLDNRAEAKHLSLVFVTGSAAANVRIALDGAAILTHAAPSAGLPAAWQPPKTTPDPDGGTLDYALGAAPTPAAFDLDVPTGRHDLTVTYDASAMLHHARAPTLVHQFAYVLSPARTWAEFGGLDVTLHVPAGWRAATVPALARDGDTLRASFPTVPADTLALSIQAPYANRERVSTACMVLFLAVLLGGPIWIVRRARAGRTRPAHAAATYAGAIVVAGIVWYSLPDALLPAAQVDHYGYGGVFGIVGLVFVAILALPVGALVAWLARRRDAAR